MTFQAVAFIDGLSYPAEAVRRLVYAATGGQTGALSGRSLTVSAGSTPGAFVNVNAGAAAIEAAEGLLQSYLVTNDQLVQLPVPANTGGSSVTRYIVYSVRDPQMAGMPPLSGPTDKAGDLQVLSALPTNKPYLHLATLVIPGNTSVITSGMITNAMKLSRPRSSVDSYVHLPTATYPLGTAYQQWSGMAVPFFCPDWATHANVVITVEGMEQVTAGYCRAMLKPTLDGVSAQLTAEVAVTRNGPIQRHGFTVGGMFAITDAQRNNTVTVGLRGQIAAGASGTYQIDVESCVISQIFFTERK